MWIKAEIFLGYSMLGWSGFARCHSRCVALAFAKHVKASSPLESNTHLPSYLHAFKHTRAIRSQQQRWQRCHSSNTPGAESREIAPPDVRELAKMAHISVTDEEVMQARICTSLSPEHQAFQCTGHDKEAPM